MQARRAIVSASELCKLINLELKQYDVAQRCEVMEIRQVEKVGRDSVNWRPTILSGAGRSDSRFIPVFARVLHRFRQEFNIG